MYGTDLVDNRYDALHTSYVLGMMLCARILSAISDVGLKGACIFWVAV
jgi:hypothetical protein